MKQTYYKRKDQIERIKKEILKYDIKTETINYNIESENELYAHAGMECINAIKEILGIKDED